MDERLQTLQQKYAIIQEQSTNDATQLAEQVPCHFINLLTIKLLCDL